MNEQLIVQASEIILILAGLLGTAVILLAAWYDLRVIARKKQPSSRDAKPPQQQTTPYATSSILALPHTFNQLNRTILKKALAWRMPVDDIQRPLLHTQHHNTPPHTVMQIAQCVGFVTFISLSTYFFHTAATLQSDTLLTLSWLATSLWLVAIIWSDDTLVLSKKIELTFTTPFMYFVFYVQSIISLIINIRQLTLKIKPATHLHRLTRAIHMELYSTRY